MFDAATVTQALFGRTGWSDVNSATLPNGSVVPLSDENKTSRSGRYFQDVHQAVTLRNVYDNLEMVNAEEADFNGCLTRLQNSAILNSLSAVFDEDTLIEQSMIFNRRADNSTSVDRVATKMGYKIVLSRDASYCSVIRSVSLLFAESGSIELIFSHSTAGELMRKTIEVDANVEQVEQIDLPLFYTSDKYKGGFFFVWFVTDLLPVELEYSDFNTTKLFRAEPFEGDDLNDVSHTSRTYGLNLEICSYQDFTQVIKSSQYVFDTLIGLQMAATVMELIINSTRSNRTERITKEAIARLYTDLNQMYPTPEFPYSTGIRGQIAREIKRVKKNMLPKCKGITITPCFT